MDPPRASSSPRIHGSECSLLLFRPIAFYEPKILTRMAALEWTNWLPEPSSAPQVRSTA